MANRKHLAILEQGVDVWNAWRADNPRIIPDLSKADLTAVGETLHFANLSGANLDDTCLANIDLRDSNLSGAELSGADLRLSDLSKADLNSTRLRYAELGGTTLRNASLRAADLTLARLRGADLRGADLRGEEWGNTLLVSTDLTGADLRGANLRNAAFSETTLGNTNLTKAKGLRTCGHLGPSTIDLRTLQKSGPLPLAFLRGCGLTSAQIDHLAILLSTPLKYASCVISYSTADDKLVRRLHSSLQDRGVQCWFAPEDMKTGESLKARIDEAIQSHDRLLLVLSKGSIASDWVKQEVETALARERSQKQTILSPITLDDAVLSAETGWAAEIRGSRHITNFKGWRQWQSYEKSFEQLLHALMVEEAT